MSSLRILSIILLLYTCTPPVLLLTGCAAKQERLRGVEYYYQEGMNALERKRYLQAVEMFQRVVSNFPGSALVTDAQFHLAESYFRMDDFVNAVFEYQRLVDAYPHSDYFERAQFQIGESYFSQMRSPEHDQKETYEALTYFRYFIDDNPASPLVEKARSRIVTCRSQLARKAYLAAELYHKRGHFEAAKISHEDLARTFPDTRWYFWSKAQLGELARREGDLKHARELWREADFAKDDDKLRHKVEQWRQEIGHGNVE